MKTFDKANISLDNTFIQNFLLRMLLNRELSLIGFIIFDIIISIIIVVLLHFLSYIKISRFLTIPIIILVSYLVGIDVCVIIASHPSIIGILMSVIHFVFSAIVLLILAISFIKMTQKNSITSSYCLYKNKNINIKLLLACCIILISLSLVKGLAFGLLFKIFVFY